MRRSLMGASVIGEDEKARPGPQPEQRQCSSARQPSHAPGRRNAGFDPGLVGRKIARPFKCQRVLMDGQIGRAAEEPRHIIWQLL